MIYLVTLNQELFRNDTYVIISPDESLEMLSSWGPMVQIDSETSGRDAHINDFLCFQIGKCDKSAQIVIDTSTVDIRLYKDILEDRYCIGQNLKFDLQFLFNYDIIPRKVYDTMIVEQLLHLGYPSAVISYALDSITKRRLGVILDKSVRGEIIWRGLDTRVIEYAAKDVVYLYDIMQSQLKECKEKSCLVGAKLECGCVPAMAYLEWCGVKLDTEKWKEKMKHDKKHLTEALERLNDYAKNHPKLQKWVKVDPQGDLWNGFDLEPKWTVDWQKSEALKVVQALGFNTNVKDKNTGKDKDSIMEKVLKPQKGIDDEFLKLYFDYQEHYKVCTSFGQGHLNAVNPITGRLHTSFKQLGATSGRMSCGSDTPNTDLAKLKKLKPGACPYVNLQQVPSDEETRSCFISEPDNLFISCDYSALESRLGADIYEDKAMLKEFLEGSGDMHSLCAYMVYTEDIPRDTNIADIKKLYPKLRKEVKGVEFSQQFGGSEYAIMGAIGCSLEKAQQFKKAYDQGFSGITEFKQRGSKFVREHGYVLMNKYTGHKMYWWDWDKWKERQESFTSEFWEDYRQHHKGSGDYIEAMVKHHFKAAAKWDRMALNGPTQGSGATIIKTAVTDLFNWIVDNGYFNKIKFCAFVHDEFCGEFPKELTDFPKIVENIMKKAAAKYCKSLPIPAEAEVGTYWKH